MPRWCHMLMLPVRAADRSLYCTLHQNLFIPHDLVQHNLLAISRFECTFNLKIINGLEYSELAALYSTSFPSCNGHQLHSSCNLCPPHVWL